MSEFDGPAAEQVIAMVEALIDQTMAREIRWGRTDQPNTFLYSATSGSVAVSGPDVAMTPFGDHYSIRIFDERGEEVYTAALSSTQVILGGGQAARLYGLLERLHNFAAQSDHRVLDVAARLTSELRAKPPRH